MISRKSANLLGQNYMNSFSSQRVDDDTLYDFLFDHDYSSWFCNAAKKIIWPRSLKEFVMKLHTGESTHNATKDWTWGERRRLGQTYLEKLAADIWQYPIDSYFTSHDRYTKDRNELKKQIEFDGYKFMQGRLIPTETDVLDSEEQAGLLETLFRKLKLGNSETALHCLKLSEKHWIDSNWDDCISNARRFFESTLQEVAATYSSSVKGHTLADSVYTRPFRVRDFLEDEGLIERQEKSTIKEVYGLLSATGSHPNIAAQDQARLLRQVALIFSHFVMLRLQSVLSPAGK